MQSPLVPTLLCTDDYKLFQQSNTKVSYAEWKQSRAQLLPTKQHPRRSAQPRPTRRAAISTHTPCKAIYIHAQKQRNFKEVYKLLAACGVDTEPIRWCSFIGSSVLELLVLEDRYDHVLANITRVQIKVFSHFDPSTPPDRRAGYRPFSDSEKATMKVAFKKRILHILNMRRPIEGEDSVSRFYQRMISDCPWFDSIPLEMPTSHPPGGDRLDA